MRVLFLHPNFPAQFKHLAKSFADNNHNTVFLCQTHYGRSIEGVNRMRLEHKSSHEELEKMNLKIFEKGQRLAKQYRAGLIALKKQGWNPDLVISHSGWGCGLYVKEIWPNTRLISYLEWWFNPQSDFFLYDQNNKILNINQDSIKKSWVRNQQLALELSVSDKVISPTKWQRSQLPKTFLDKCEVIFDGIDLNRFRPDAQNIRKNVITYGTRGMDPMRCFPQFIESIPEILEHNSNISIEIAGEDKAFYGNPLKGITWGNWAKKYLSDRNLGKRVKWVGRLQAGKYEKWLKTSGTHVYLSHPFVTSWSLVEAYCCGSPLVVSDIEATKEICSIGNGAAFVDHRQIKKISAKVIDMVETINNSDESYASAGRATIFYGVEASLKRWEHVAGVELATND